MTDPDVRPLALPRPETFRYEERDRVGIITLDRADRFNALTFAVYRELTDLFAVIDRRSLDPQGARALVLRGENLTDEDIVTRNQGGSIDYGTPRTVWAGIKVGL